MTENQESKLNDEMDGPANPQAAGQISEGAAAADIDMDDSGRLTAEQIEALVAKAAKADEHWDRLLRAKADLENYRKRAARERQEAIQYAQASLLEKLVPALDSFDMALAAARAPGGTNMESLKTGLDLVYSQLKTALNEVGLEEIDASQQVFDPNIHEALSQQDSAEVPEGHVLQQVRRGYRLKERLIRPASVIVAKKPEA